MPTSSRASRRWQRVALGYLALVIGAEIVTWKWSVPLGVLCHGVLLLALLGHYVVASSTGRAARPEPPSAADNPLSVLPILGLISTLRIASITMPNAELAPVYWYALVSVALASGIVLTARLIGARRADLGLRWTAWQPVIAFIGLPLGLVAVELPQQSPALTGDNVLLASAFVVALGGLEEILFRGMVQHSLVQLFGGTGVLLTAVLATASMSASGSLKFVVFSGAVSLFFGALVYRTGSVVGVAAAHAMVNVIAFVVVPDVSLFGL